MLNLGFSQIFLLLASPCWGEFYEWPVRSVNIPLKKDFEKSMLR